MDSKKNEPIRLSEDETEVLTRALAEAQAQAEGPRAFESDTQLFRRTANSKTSHAPQVPGTKNTTEI